MKAYQEIFFQEYVFIKFAVVIYVAMCCQSLISDAWVHAYISVQDICTLIRRAG
jgi:hypothetical protein